MTFNMYERPSKPQGHNLRVGRVSESGRIYLLTTVTHQRQPVFANFKCGRELVRCMRHHYKQGELKSLAFVIMPDHLHWLVLLTGVKTLPIIMRSFKGYAAKLVNNLRNTPGERLWQPGYHDHALRREEDVRTIARYIVANPIRAGLVDNVGRYPLWDVIWL